MEALVLNPTDTSQWQKLVNEAQANCATQLGEELESYLVFMLMRYAAQPDLATSVLALDFFEGHHAVGQQRQMILRDVGDKCLLFSGLFPGRAEKRQVKISYFVDLGQTAYGELSTLAVDKLAMLFAALCHGFVPLMDVLQAMRNLDKDGVTLQPLEALELWYETGSQQALEALKQYTDGTPYIIDKQKN